MLIACCYFCEMGERAIKLGIVFPLKITNWSKRGGNKLVRVVSFAKSEFAPSVLLGTSDEHFCQDWRITFL